MFTPNIGMWECDHCGFRHGCWYQSISDLLGFSCTTLSRVYTEPCIKSKNKKWVPVLQGKIPYWWQRLEENGQTGSYRKTTITQKITFYNHDGHKSMCEALKCMHNTLNFELDGVQKKILWSFSNFCSIFLSSKITYTNTLFNIYLSIQLLPTKKFYCNTNSKFSCWTVLQPLSGQSYALSYAKWDMR